MNNRLQRESNFELLRILSMLAVIAGHFLSQSPAFLSCVGAKLVEIVVLGSMVRIAVNVFLFIGCWFMVDRAPRPDRALKLYLQVFFYSVPVSLLMLLMGGDAGMADVLQGLLPFLFRPIWFACAYISLMLLAPYLNGFFKLEAKIQGRIALLLVFAFIIPSSIPYSTPLDYIADVSWFVIAYVLIGYVKHKGMLDRLNRWLWLALALGCYAVLCCGLLLPSARNFSNFYAINLKSIPNILCALGIFAFFKTLDIGRNHIINTVAIPCFSVYIIHQIPAYRQFQWSVVCQSARIVELSPIVMPLVIASLVISLYVLYSVIDFVRIRWIEKYFLKLFAKWL